MTGALMLALGMIGGPVIPPAPEPSIYKPQQDVLGRIVTDVLGRILVSK